MTGIRPIILAGGSGSRLWPLSRKLFPKQFLSLTGPSTMLQETVYRLRDIDHLPPYIICNESHRFLTAEQLRQGEILHGGIILEPVARDTAPAVAIAALKAMSTGEDPLLLVLAADHQIKNIRAFTNAVQEACIFSEQGKLVTFGIVPNKPETGYGYIRKGRQVQSASCSAYIVDSFIEKPTIDKAIEYIETGEFCWNSGMFLFKASRFIEELSKYRPDILSYCQNALESSQEDLEFVRLGQNEFKNCPSESIDYAIMEHTQDAVVLPMKSDWSDVGAWSSLWEISEKDDQGNVTRGDIITEGTQNSYIVAPERLVATVGVEDLVIIDTKDALLVANRNKVQDVKNIVNNLKSDGRSEHINHREVYRPWGQHDHIAEGKRYHVKKVTVKSGGKTATQVHHHRAEHWVVVSGTARVHNGNETYLVSENQSTFIPIGAPHSFENPGVIPLELIEVRTGAYLEENDIVRVDENEEGY